MFVVLQISGGTSISLLLLLLLFFWGLSKTKFLTPPIVLSQLQMCLQVVVPISSRSTQGAQCKHGKETTASHTPQQHYDLAAS